MAGTAVRSVAIRLEMQGDDIVVKKLDQLGKGGDAALNRLKNSAKEVPGYLKGIDAASSGLQSEMEALGARTGVIGRGLMAIGPVGLGVAATLGAVALAAHFAFGKTEEAMQFADTLETTAKRLHITTDELQLLTAAAVKADVPQESLTAGLVTLKQKTDEYVAGLMRAREARPFQVLGLSREEMSASGTAAQQLLLIADALSKIQDRSVRQGIAERLGLGSLLPLLEKGRGGIEELFAEARRNGQVMDSSLVEPLDRASKKSGELHRAMQIDWAKSFAGFAPVINGALGLLDLFIQKLSLAASLWSGNAKPYFNLKNEVSVGAKPGTGITVGATPGGLNTDAFSGGHRWGLGNNVFVGVRPDENKPEKAGPVTKLPPTLEEINAAEALRQKMKRLSDERQAFIDRMSQIDAAANSAEIAAQDKADVERLKGKLGYYDAIAKLIRDSADAEIAEIQAAAKTEFDELDKLERKFKDAGKSVPADLEAERARIGAVRDSKISTVRTKQGSAAADNAREAGGELQKLIDQINGPLDVAMNTAAAHGLEGFTDALVGIATGSETAAAAVKNMATSIIADLARIIIQRNVTTPIANFMQGALASMFGGGHAGGGGVSAGVMYPVNENGVEILQTNQNAYVLDSGRSIGAITAAVAKQLRPSVVVSQSPARVEIHNHGAPVAVQSQEDDHMAINPAQAERCRLSARGW